MIICSCNVISDHEVRDAASSPEATGSISQVYRDLGRKPRCGHCKRTIKAIVREVCADAERVRAS
jgi:bacterioferritin-associated ferredoxin